MLKLLVQDGVEYICLCPWRMHLAPCDVAVFIPCFWRLLIGVACHQSDSRAGMENVNVRDKMLMTHLWIYLAVKRLHPLHVLAELAYPHGPWLLPRPDLEIGPRGLSKSDIYIYIFLLIPFIIFAHLHLSLLPTRNSDPGSHSRLPYPLPATVRAFIFIDDYHTKALSWSHFFFAVSVPRCVCVFPSTSITGDSRGCRGPFVVVAPISPRRSPPPAPRFARSIRFHLERVAQLIASLKKPLQFRLWVSPYIINPKDLVSTDNPRVLNPGGQGDTTSGRGLGYAPCHGVTHGGMASLVLGGGVGVGNARKRYSVCVLSRLGKYAAQTTSVAVPPFWFFSALPGV